MAIYFGPVFTISWVGTIVVSALKFIRKQTIEFTDLLPAFLPMPTAPSVLGTTFMGIVNGSSGLRDLFSRLSNLRVAAGWFGVVLRGRVQGIENRFSRRRSCFLIRFSARRCCNGRTS